MLPELKGEVGEELTCSDKLSMEASVALIPSSNDVDDRLRKLNLHSVVHLRLNVRVVWGKAVAQDGPLLPGGLSK